MKISISFECTKSGTSASPSNKCNAYKNLMWNGSKLDTISRNFVRQSRVLEHILKRLSYLEKVQAKSE